MSAAVKSSSCTFSGCGRDIFKMGYCIEHWRTNRAPVDNRKKLVPVKKTQISGAVVELMSSVKKQSGFARMIEYSIECVTKMAVDETSVEEIIENGTIETLLEAVKKHPKNEKLMKMFMDMLAKFAMNERLAKMVADRLGNDFSLFTHSLLNHTDVSTHMATCRAILALGQHAPNLDAMKRDGVLDALSSMISSNDNPELLALGAQCLTRFAEVGGVEYCNAIMSTGAVAHLLKALAMNPGDLALARAVVSMMAALAANSKENVAKLKEMGAVDIISASLECNPYDEMLLEAAARALKALTGESDMAFLLSKIGEYLNATVANVALIAKVSNLLLVGDNVDYMMQHKGVDWLISTLNHLAGKDDDLSLKMLASACRALQRVATDENKIYKLIKQGAIKALLAVLHGNVNDANVVAAALSALAKFCSRPENAVYVAKSGILQAALKAGDTHMGNAFVVRPLVNLHGALTTYPQTHDLLKNAGAIQQLLEILRRHGDDPLIVSPVLNALGRLMTSEENVKKMVDGGLLPLLVKVLNDHPDDMELCKAALLAMETAAFVPLNVEHLNRLNACGAIANVLKRQPDSGEIQSIGARVMHMLKNDAELREAEERARELERIQLEHEERMRREEEEEMARALQQLREQDEEEERRRRKKKQEEDEAAKRKAEADRLRAEEDLKLRAYQAKINAEQEHLKRLLNGPKKVEEQKLVLKKSARDIFGKDDTVVVYEELNEEVKQFLQGGALLTKHSRTAPPRRRHIYLSHDCKYIVWKEPGAKDIKANCRMKVERIFAVEKGKCTAQLQRLMPVSNKAMAQEDLAFAIFGSEADGGEERTVDLEGRTQMERDKWVEAIEVLIEWAKQHKLYGGSTMRMTDNEEVWDKEKAKGVPQQ